MDMRQEWTSTCYRPTKNKISIAISRFVTYVRRNFSFRPIIMSLGLQSVEKNAFQYARMSFCPEKVGNMVLLASEWVGAPKMLTIGLPRLTMSWRPTNSEARKTNFQHFRRLTLARLILTRRPISNIFADSFWGKKYQFPTFSGLKLMRTYRKEFFQRTVNPTA